MNIDNTNPDLRNCFVTKRQQKERALDRSRDHFPFEKEYSATWKIIRTIFC